MTSIHKVLIAIDDESDNKLAIETGMNFATQHNADVLIYGVVPKYSDRLAMLIADTISEDQFRKDLIDNLRKRIEEEIKNCRTFGTNIRVETTFGKSFIEFIKKALYTEANIIVKASRSKNENRLFFSSTDWHLIRKSPIPVWIVKGNRLNKLKRVVVALDVLEQSDHQTFNEELLSMAANIASKSNAHLAVYSAWELFGLDVIMSSPSLKNSFQSADKILEKTASTVAAEHEKLQIWLKKHSLINETSVSWHIENAKVQDSFPKFANDHDIDLIVMGTLNRIGIPGFFIGNTAETILSKVKCSVLTMKPSKFDGPII